MLLDIPAVVNGLNRISSSSSSIEANEVSFLARGTSNTSANKARQIMRVCRILRLMRLVYLYNQYELHKQVRLLYSCDTACTQNLAYAAVRKCMCLCGLHLCISTSLHLPVHADKIFPIRRTLKLVIPLPSQKQADNYGMHAGPVSSTKLVNLFVFANVGLALDALVLDRVNTAMSPLLGSLMMQVTVVELSSCMQHSGEDNGD